MDGRDRFCRPTNQEPHSWLLFRLYQVGEIGSGGHVVIKEKK